METNNKYSFGYPTSCVRCTDDTRCSYSKVNLNVEPHFKQGSRKRLLLIGQDPTIRKKQDRVKEVLMLNDENSQLARWLRKLFGEDNFKILSVYATNLVKCTFDVVPFDNDEKSGFEFIKPYFTNCKEYLIRETQNFKPTVVMTLGEPSHIYFRSILDNSVDIPDKMHEAFTGKMYNVSIRGFKFKYTPCLHIQTFRVAETYGKSVVNFKKGLEDYLTA